MFVPCLSNVRIRGKLDQSTRKLDIYFTEALLSRRLETIFRRNLPIELVSNSKQIQRTCCSSKIKPCPFWNLEFLQFVFVLDIVFKRHKV